MNYTKYTPYFLFFISIAQHAFSAPPIRTIINTVLEAKPSMRPHKFFNAVTQEYIMPTSSSRAERLKKGKRLHLMAPILILGIEHLHAISGFPSTLHYALYALDQETAAGQYYEIEKALEILTARSGETILCMNCKVVKPDQTDSIYVDIVTSRRIIECKAIAWSRNPQNLNPITNKLCNQFLSQQRIVQSMNATAKNPVDYEVHSKHHITALWKEWFAQNAIRVIEEKA